MIYLIDDKKDRQSKYSWTKEKFNFYKDEIVPIWTYEDMESEEFRREMFNEQNILIIHESFFKNIEHDRVNNIVQVKERLKSRENLVIYFSGGIYSRSKNANRIYLPISTLYQNLELFIIKKRQNDINIDYLIYGKNKEIEIELGNKWQLSRNTIINFNDIFNNSNSLLIQSNRYFVYEEKPIGYNSEVLNLENDFTLNDRFDNVFNRNKYDNIFVPLCFGSTLSDFNGLGLACYIRCSKSLNQTTRIFIYGVVSSDYLLQNNYFNILKTKNTHLIDYSIEAFKNAVQKDQQPFLQKELQNELAKLKLDVTEDHVDDHSIANEFGIYQLAYNAGIDINEITDFDKDKLDSLYFKWLIAKNGLYEALPEEVQQENRIFRNKIIIQGFTIVDKIDLTKKSKKMRILLIDDNANKGWKQIIEKVFPVTDMIVQVALNLQEAENKIEDKFDLIFLDVRLSEQDHNVTNPTEYSGYKILEKIKNNFLNMNFATPIILITATNKIWNVDAFRNYGIDGYYIKEHPNYVFDKETSKQNYNNLKTKFIELKAIGQKRNDIWKLSKDIIDKISKHSYFKENKKYENVKDRIIDKLKLGYDYLFKEPNELEKKVLKTNNEAIAFIIYWSILEEIVKGYSEYKNWKSPDYTFSGNWKFRNTEYFIERDNDTIEVNISKDIRGNWVSQGVQENANIIDFKYINGKINLSEQVYSLLAAYQRDNQQFQSLSNGFNSINSFRNKIDFIHSKIKNIYERPLINEKDSTEQYDFCIKQLTFVKNILSLLP